MMYFKRFGEALKVVLTGGKEPPILRFIFAIGLFYPVILAHAQGVDAPSLEFRLSIPGGMDRDFLVGEAIPLDLVFTNKSDSAVYVVKPLDGSIQLARYPHYQIQVNAPVPLFFIPPRLWCGTLNPLLESDFFRIEAGDTKILPSEETYLWYKPKMAGKHDMVCAVDFNGSWESYSWEYEDPQTVELKPYWEMIPKIAVRSATVTINVVSNGKTLDPKYHCLMGMPYEEVQRVFNASSQGAPANPWGLDDSYYLPYYLFFLNLHFDRNNVVNGVELLNNLSETSNISLEHLKALRGGEAVEHESVVYQDDYIEAIRVGYFADPSGVSEEMFKGLR